MQDKIDILFKRKKFFKIIFPKLNKREYIRIFQKKNEKNKTTFWNDIDDMNNYIEKYKFSTNTYFSLATTNNQGGTTNDIKHRYCIALDFDKKLDNSINAKELMFKFKKIGLWYHALIDSGHGFHVYICIQETDDIEKVTKVTKVLSLLLQSDLKANLATQILRVPLTYNLKDIKHKQVNIIHMFPKKTIKPYDINDLYHKYCNETNNINKDITIQYAKNNTNIPPCINTILNGVIEGERNWCLKRLISYFRLYGYNQNESYVMIKEWNQKCAPSISDQELEYQFNYIWDKPYKCFGCKTNDAVIQEQIYKYCNKQICNNRNKNNNIEESVQIEYKIFKKIEFSRRQKKMQISGNELLILIVLKYNEKGLHTSEILQELTYNKEQYMNKITLNKYLQKLEEKKLIIKKNGNKKNREENLYIVRSIRTENFKMVNISFFCILGVLKKEISSEDLKIYCYIKYRLQQGLDVTQSSIADNLGVTQQVVSFHINNLINTRYIDIVGKDRAYGKYGFNVYRLNN